MMNEQMTVPADLEIPFSLPAGAVQALLNVLGGSPIGNAMHAQFISYARGYLDAVAKQNASKAPAKKSPTKKSPIKKAPKK